jgi:PKD repeat protein
VSSTKKKQFLQRINYTRIPPYVILLLSVFFCKVAVNGNLSTLILSYFSPSKNYKMKKTTFYLTLLIGLVLSCSRATAQIVHTESFDATQFLPTGWVAVGTAPDWARTTTLATPLTGGPHSGTGMARMRNQSASTAALTETICTPVFDLSGRGTNTVPVSFWIHRDSLMATNFDSLGVFVNTAANLTGATKIGTVARNRSINVPDTKSVNGWYQYTFDIPIAFSGSSNYVLLQATVYGPSATARRLYIDDVSWTEFPPVCAGTPSPGTTVASTSIICGGSGAATLSLTAPSTGTGITYDWYESTAVTGPFTLLGANMASISTGTITATHYYFSQVSCTGSGLSANSDTIAVTVNPNAAPVVSITALNDTICRNDTLVLTANGANTYLWSTTFNPNLSTASTLSDVPQNTTTYSLIGYDALGCPSTSVSQTIVVGRRPTINALTISNDTICANGSSIITVNATSGVGGGGGGGVTLYYNWNPAVGTTNTVTVTPTITTDYMVTVVGQYGCFTLDTATVTVNPLLISPVVSVTPDSLNICQGNQGSTTQLVATSSVLSSTYSWSSSNGTPITSTSDSLTVTIGNNSVTYTVTATDPANGCGSAAHATIYIRPVPNVNLTSQNTTVCLNGSTTLNTQVTNTQGTSISLYAFNYTPTAPSTQTTLYTPLASGNVFVQVTSPYGCSRIDSLMITVDSSLLSPSLALNASAITLCSDNLAAVNLVAVTDAVNGSFSWTPFAVNQNNDSITVNPTVSTNYGVTVTDANGCSTAATTTVTVEAAPVAGFTTSAMPSMDVTFTNTSTNATTYLWDFGDGTTSTLQDPSHTYTSSGNYTVLLIAVNDAGCDDTTAMVLQAQTNGVDELTDDFIVYPNPVTDQFTIAGSLVKNVTMSCVTATGNVLFTQLLNADSTTVDVANLPTGLYFIELMNETGMKSVYQLVKK